MPHHHPGFNVQLLHRPGYRDAMVPIPDKVDFADLDQAHRRQALAPQKGVGDAQPASAAVVLQGIEVAVKVVASPFAAHDLPDGHGVHASMATGADGARGLDLGQM